MPAEVDTEVIYADLVVALAQQLYDAARLGAGTPRGKQVFDRMCAPTVGDMVLMVSAGFDDPATRYRRVGLIEEIEPDPCGGSRYLLRNIHTDMSTTTTWTNATAIALPVSLTSRSSTAALFLPHSRSVPSTPAAVWYLPRMR